MKNEKKLKRNQLKCCVNGCDRNVHTKTHMLCKAHYVRYATKGEVGSPKIRKRKKLPIYKPK